MESDLDVSGRAPCLVGSRDPQTGQTYFPARVFAADGSLRSCEVIRLSATGHLVTWTKFAGRHLGQVDLPDGVRVQTELTAGAHEIGAEYALDIQQAEDGKVQWRFRRV